MGGTAGHYFINFMMTTSGIIVLLYAVYAWLKQHPSLAGRLGGAVGAGKQSPQLQIESILPLEPRKRLYVVTYAQQRFLVSTTLDKTELLTPLDTPDPAYLQSLEDAESQAQAEQAQRVADYQSSIQSSTWQERAVASVRLVLTERFSQSRGK